MQSAPFVKLGHDSADAVPTTHGLAQLHTPETKVQVPGAKKSGLGAMLAAGFEIVSAGVFLAGGGLLTIVVGVGATVVGVTTVVGGVVVEGLFEPFDTVRDLVIEDLVATIECRTTSTLA